ncbi:unnamed protein product [Symbiodinium sp. CCMP2592]|nr:unnamed protein product [Symbiodinium sp. CCMP2592]
MSRARAIAASMALEGRRRPLRVLRGTAALGAAVVLTGWLTDALARTFLLPRSSAGSGALAGHTLQRSSPRPHFVLRRAEGPDAAEGVRVGLIHVPELKDKAEEMRAALEKLNVTNATYFQTEVPEAEQVPLAAKLLAMSNTVDVVVAGHGDAQEAALPELLRAYQTVALTTNVPIVSLGPTFDAEKKADTAVQMAEIRQQALMGAGKRSSMFFGIGTNKTSGEPSKKGKAATGKLISVAAYSRMMATSRRIWASGGDERPQPFKETSSQNVQSTTRTVDLTSIQEICSGGELKDLQVTTPLDENCVTLVMADDQCVSFKFPDKQAREHFATCMKVLLPQVDKTARLFLFFWGSWIYWISRLSIAPRYPTLRLESDHNFCTPILNA